MLFLNWGKIGPADLVEEIISRWRENGNPTITGVVAVKIDLPRPYALTTGLMKSVADWMGMAKYHNAWSLTTIIPFGQKDPDKTRGSGKIFQDCQEKAEERLGRKCPAGAGEMAKLFLLEDEEGLPPIATITIVAESTSGRQTDQMTEALVSKEFRDFFQKVRIKTSTDTSENI